MVIKIQDNTRLYRLEEIQELFEVPEANRGLRVLVNKRLVDAALDLARDQVN